MDLGELFTAFAEQAVAATQPQVVETPEPAHVYTLRKKDGTFEQHAAAPVPRDHECESIDSFVSYCLEKGIGAVVWYSRAGVVAILDDATRRDKVTIPLQLSPQMQRLLALERDSRPIAQAEFLKLLRISLSGCAISDVFINSVKRLKMTGTAVVEQANRSIGKTLESQLDGSASFPETLALNLPVFAGNVHPAPYAVTCAVEVDPNGLFQLIPLPGLLECTIQRAEEDVGNRLRQGLSENPIYFGKP